MWLVFSSRHKRLLSASALCWLPRTHLHDPKKHLLGWCNTVMGFLDFFVEDIYRIPSHWCNMHPQRVRNYYTCPPAPAGWLPCWETGTWYTGVFASGASAQHQMPTRSNTGDRRWRGRSQLTDTPSPVARADRKPDKLVARGWKQGTEIRGTAFFPVFSIYLSSAMCSNST